MRVVFTGGPGAGKTTLLNALAAQGHAVVGETARALIQSRRAQGLPPRPAPRAFAEAILAQDIEKHRQHGAQGRVFFDRGVPDALGMLCECEPSRRGEWIARAARHPYHRQAFFFPPWESIFQSDAERDQSFGHALRIYKPMMDWYLACGYQIVEVPRTSVVERCTFVLRALDAAAGA